MAKIDLNRRAKLREKWFKDISDDDYDELWILEIAQEGERQYSKCSKFAKNYILELAKAEFGDGNDAQAGFLRELATQIEVHLDAFAPTHETEY